MRSKWKLHADSRVIYTFLWLVTAFFLPSFDFGFDSFYLDGLAKGLFSTSPVPNRPTYTAGYHLFPWIKLLSGWIPTLPWTTLISQALFLTALALLFRILSIHKISTFHGLLCFLLIVVHWIQLQIGQVGFWPALIGGYAFLYLNNRWIQGVGLLLFIAGLLSKDFTAIIATSILVSVTIFNQSFRDLPKFIPRFALLIGIILPFLISIPLTFNPVNLKIDNYLTLCNDLRLCNPDYLNMEDRQTFNRVFTYWFVPDGSPAELQKIERIINIMNPSLGNLFSPYRLKMNVEHLHSHFWLLPILICVSLLVAYEFILSPQHLLLKLAALSIPACIIILRPSAFWIVNMASGWLIVQILQCNSLFVRQRIVRIGSTLLLCLAILVCYIFSFWALPFHSQAAKSLPNPKLPVSVIGSNLHFLALANLTPAGFRPAMFQPGSRTLYYPLVEMAANSEGLHLEVARYHGFANWFEAMSRRPHILYSEEAFAKILLDYVHEQNPRTRIQLRKLGTSFQYGTTPIYEYRIINTTY